MTPAPPSAGGRALPLGHAETLRRRSQVAAWARPRAARVVIGVPPGAAAPLTAGQARDRGRGRSGWLNHLADLMEPAADQKELRRLWI
jgi:hypothetical protein